MATYKKYNREQYLKDFATIMDLRPMIENYMDEAFAEGVDNLVLAGVGGTMAIMMPFEAFAKKRTTVPVYLENAAEVVLGTNKAITERSLVVLYSDSGTTKETVALAKYCREKGIPTIGVSCTEGAPLQEYLKYPIVSKAADAYSCDGDFMRLSLIVGTFLKKTGDFPDYEEFMESLANAPKAMADIKEAVEDEVKEYAYSIKDEPYHMLVGSGNLWGSTYCFAMCYLEEMQWIHTKSITAPEFFHGTLELLEEDTSIMIFKGEDETRVLAERVENFAKKISKKVKVVDTKDYPAEGIAEKYREDFAPFFLEAYLGRLIAHLEDATGHSLDIRRYYRVMDY